MTHSFQCNRKQKREENEDFEDYIPSAKRAKLKNFRETPNAEPTLNHSFFHIPTNPSQFVLPNKDEVCEDRSSITNVNYQRGIAQYNIAQTDSYRLEEHNPQTNLKYLPDLTANENPHYYENNRLLFELYVERTQRSLCHPSDTSHA